MSDALKVLGMAGSLRKGSFNRWALRAAQQLAPPGMKIDVFELAGFPAFNQDEEKSVPQIVSEFKQKIRAADAILISTPEYNYSLPGVLKNAIDWASRPYGDSAWKGKPVAVMGASGGTLGTARAQYHLRQMFVFLDMYAMNQPEVMIASAQEKFDADGSLNDAKTKEMIRRLLAALEAWTKRLGKPAA
jgi:chromate reductase